MMNKNLSTVDTTMTDVYYAMNEGTTQPTAGLFFLWDALRTSSDAARQNHKLSRRSR